MRRKKSLADENWDYYLGETFEYWNGAIPPKNSPLNKDYYRALKRIYHSYNLVKEVTTHYVNSLVGKPFTYTITGSGAATAQTILDDWWKWEKRCSVKQKLSQGRPIGEAIAQMLVRDNGGGDGSGFLRLFAPQKYRHYAQSDTPWKQFVLHCPLPGSVKIDDDDDNVTEKIEHYHNSQKWTYELLDSGLCLINKNDGEEVRTIDLEGKLPILELNGKCIIGTDTKQIQNSINHVLTLKDMNLKYAGFLERVLLNTAPPGKYIEHPDGRREFVASNEKFEFGSDKVVMLQGLQYGGMEDFKVTNPQIVYREPVSIENFKESVYLDIETLYMSVQLGHFLAVGDGSVSGKSRIASQKDYGVALEGYAETIEAIIEDVCLILLKMVNPDLDVEIDVELDISHDLLKDTVEIVNLMLENGLISLDTGRRRLSIPDPEGEGQKVLSEKEAEIALGELDQVISNE